MEKHKTLLQWRREIVKDIIRLKEVIYNNYVLGEVTYLKDIIVTRYLEKQRQLQMVNDIIEMIQYHANNEIVGMEYYTFLNKAIGDRYERTY